MDFVDLEVLSQSFQARYTEAGVVKIFAGARVWQWQIHLLKQEKMVNCVNLGAVNL